MTHCQSTAALRRESIVLQAKALMVDPPEGQGMSLNCAAEVLKVPVASLHRYVKAYDAGGFDALIPKQAGNSGAKSMRERFVEAVGAETLEECEKKVAALALDLCDSVAETPRRLSDGLAWRTFARSADCPEPIRQYFADGLRRSKHSIAASLRESTRPGALLAARHRGTRTYGLAGPYQPRELDILPGDIFSSDDTTPIWAWWIPWPKSEKYPHGVKLLQGQFLPVIDVASQRILSYALIAREQSSYRAADIWRLMGRVHSTVGLPRLGWQKERGSWEAQIIDGVEAAVSAACDGISEPSHAQRVGGLRMLPAKLLPFHLDRLGDKATAWRTLRTFTSYLPKSKSVEGVFHRLQKFEGTIYGILGRSQQRRPFEKTKKIYEACRAGKADPRLHFQSGTALLEKINACIDLLEAEPIEGEVFRGRPVEVWEKGLEEHGQLLSEPPEGRWLMCCDWSLVTVRQGYARVRRVDEVTGQPVSYFYHHGDFLGQLDGRQVLVYFNRDAFEEPAHILLPNAESGNHQYLGQAEYVERRGMFLDGDLSGFELRHRQSGLVTTLYSDLARYCPSRHVPADLAQRRASFAIETRHPGGDMSAVGTILPSGPDFDPGQVSRPRGSHPSPFDESAELARIAALEATHDFAVP